MQAVATRRAHGLAAVTTAAGHRGVRRRRARRGVLSLAGAEQPAAVRRAGDHRVVLVVVVDPRAVRAGHPDAAPSTGSPSSSSSARSCSSALAGGEQPAVAPPDGVRAGDAGRHRRARRRGPRASYRPGHPARCSRRSPGSGTPEPRSPRARRTTATAICSTTFWQPHGHRASWSCGDRRRALATCGRSSGWPSGPAPRSCPCSRSSSPASSASLVLGDTVANGCCPRPSSAARAGARRVHRARA